MLPVPLMTPFLTSAVPESASVILRHSSISPSILDNLGNSSHGFTILSIWERTSLNFVWKSTCS